ncbi:hypothetical protein DFH06DRAFT_1389002 [Mycena polygramma]|nr:hypothetical protein DFH06DRAFT_1389002 [Mycena polygramma]
MASTQKDPSCSQLPAPIPTHTHADGVLQLCICGQSVGIYPKPPQHLSSDAQVAQTMTVHPPINDSPFVYLLAGDLSEFTYYSRHEETRWLLDIGHDLYDPLAMRGALVRWDESNRIWCSTLPTDALAAAIYCYVLPANIIVGMAKISEKAGNSKTSRMGSAAETMRSRVLARDKKCWINGSKGPLRNGHILPKRMGDHLARQILQDFCPTTLGTYEAHVFAPLYPNDKYTIHGVYPLDSSFPSLHGHPVSPPRPEASDFPPSGLFRWHYLQCVVSKFAHPDYRNLDHIIYSVTSDVPFEGDSDDGSSDSEADYVNTYQGSPDAEDGA